MYTFHVFLTTIFFSPHVSLNLSCDVPKSLLFKVNSVGNPEDTKRKSGSGQKKGTAIREDRYLK